MKSFIYIFALFFSVALLTSCLDPSEKNKDDEPYSIELVNDVVVLSADETQKPNSIEFTVSDDWYIAPETNPETEYKGSDWVTVDTEHGSKGIHSIGIIAQANFSGKEREAAFRLTCGEKQFSYHCKTKHPHSKWHDTRLRNSPAHHRRLPDHCLFQIDRLNPKTYCLIHQR